MSKVLVLFICLSTFYSCSKSEKGPLVFVDRIGNELARQKAVSLENQRILEEELFLKNLEAEKKVEWLNITEQAKESYQPISELVKKKCFDCHDSKTKLPFYGRIFPRYNFVNKHQVDGLAALDFADTFPLKTTSATPDQVAMLKAIRNAVIDKTMPLKSYKLFYPFKRITKQDQEDFLNWVDPLIEEIENFEKKYEILLVANSIEAKTQRLIQKKCLRCHGNGNNRGGFGGLEDLEKTVRNPKFGNLESPEKSLLYTLSFSGEMPTDPRERLSGEELQLMLDYIDGLE